MFAGYTHLWDPKKSYTDGNALSEMLERIVMAGTVHEIAVPLCKEHCLKEPERGIFFKGTFDFDKVTCRHCKRYVRNNVGMWNRARTIFLLINSIKKEPSQA